MTRFKIRIKIVKRDGIIYHEMLDRDNPDAYYIDSDIQYINFFESYNYFYGTTVVNDEEWNFDSTNSILIDVRYDEFRNK